MESMTWITLGLAVASLILHWVAPRTKTKADDIARDVVDVAKGLAPKLPQSREVGGTVQAPGTLPPGGSRDHRTK